MVHEVYAIKSGMEHSLWLITAGVVSLQCNEGASGIHGFPMDLQPHTCEDGVVNCAKIVGSKFSIPEIFPYK